MKFKIGRAFVIMVVLGVMLSVAGFKDAKMYVEGKVIDLNSASMEDFRKECMVEGDIAYVDGRFATYEEKEKTLGVTTSKRNTHYYLVENISMADMEKFVNGEETDEPDNYFTYVVSVSSSDLKAELDANCSGWADFFDGKTNDMPKPVHFEGKLWAQPKSKEYLKIRNDSLKEIGFDVSEVAEMKVMDAKPDVMSLVLFIGGIVVALIGAVVIIASFVKSRRKYDDEFYY